MATQYSTILKLALPTQGELSGTWGDVVNNNITSMVEEAIAGRAVINTWSTNSHTLTTANGTTSESRCAMLEFTDTGTALSGAGTVICPTASKIYICKNDAGQTVTIKTSAGTGVAIADGETKFVFCDGTNVVEAVTSIETLSTADLTATTADINGGTIDGTVIGGSSAAAGSFTTLSASGEIAANGGIALGDNDKATFGASDDLQIYHDGTRNYIDSNTTELRLQTSELRMVNSANTEIGLKAVEDGAVTLYYDAASRLSTTSTGIDVTGTVTADGLTVDGATLLNNGTNSTHLTLTGTTNRGLTISTTNTAGQNDSGAIYDAQDTAGGGVGSHEFRIGGESKLLIAADGDISFYEDTGTTAKFFWDASAESLGIGTTTTTAKLNVAGDSVDGSQARVTGGTNENYQLRLGFDTTNLVGKIQSIHVGTAYKDLSLQPDGGNVGIGTTTPATTLHTTSTTTGNIAGFFENSTGNTNRLYIGADSGLSYIDATAGIGSTALGFKVASTERMRIDSAGNLLVGGTGTPTSSAGNMVLYNGTAPTGNATDGVILYAEDVSSSSELKVRDEAGNVTTLSPHNFDLIPEGPSEDMAWSYYSERDGKRINVDMLKAIRVLEKLSGQKLVFEN